MRSGCSMDCGAPTSYSGSIDELDFNGWKVSDLYQKYAGRLQGLLCGRFGLPSDAAEDAIHDIFVSLLTSRPRDPARWLIGAAYNQGRSYWRRARRLDTSAIDPPLIEPQSDISASILADEVLARLPTLSSAILRERFLEGFSAREIAARRSISERYAHKLIRTSLSEARDVSESVGCQ